MNEIWVDVPSGWKYGFPKIYDKEQNPDMRKWLVDNGYPQSILDEFPQGLTYRMWEASDDDVEEYYKQLYYKY